MFDTQTRFFGLFVVLLFCAATVLAEVSIIVANFEEVSVKRPNSKAHGTLYYKYDSANPKNCRLRYEYTLPKNNVVKNLYNYNDGAIYSMCTAKCTGLRTTEAPDPWYYVSNVYTKGNKEGDYYWYTRKPLAAGSTASPQVSKILMGTSTSPSNQISKIELNDGRTLTLSSVQKLTSGYDDKFVVESGLNCPKPTCPIYADLIFVLDNSNSVSDSSWRKGGNFVDAVMQSFTFGIDAVEASIIQFNAPPAYMCETRTVSGCDQCYTDRGFVTTYNGITYTYPGWGTAEIVAGKDYGEGMTLSPDRIALETVMNASRPARSGQTCQGYGLELAKTILDRSPRKNYAKKPQPIIIAVTDGADWCPNKTADAAESLRKDYGAFVAEIGVGLYTGCGDYDRNFLRRIASKIGTSDNPAYYDVSDYGAIHKVTEQLFKPICDDFNSDCGPDCLGFCGCGQCFCPECDDTGSSCTENTCASDGSSSTGCVTSDIPCPVEDNICTWWTCNGDVTGDGRCTATDNKCEELVKKNPGACRTVKCDPSVAGGCYVEINDAYCSNKFGNQCEIFVCTPENETVDPRYAESGCKLFLNKTKQKEDELRLSGEIKCFDPTCDKSSGVTGKKDMCQSRLSTPLCHTSSCQKVGGNFECINKERPHKSTTRCTQYVCNETTNGWIDETIDNIDSCTEKFENDPKYDMRCLTAHCDDDLGCVVENVTGCSTECTAVIIKKCVKEGYEKSSVKACYLMSCDARQSPEDPSIWEPYCKDPDHPVNCLENETLVKKAADDSDNSTQCCHVVCGVEGVCDVECDDYPSYPVDDECMYWVCLERSTGTWEWVYNATKTNYTCHNDACSDRICDKTEGCIMAKDTCSPKSTNCTKYTCVVHDDGSKECVGETLLRNSTCKWEFCDDEADAIVRRDYLENCTKMEEYNKCLNPSCIYDAKTKTSTCNFTPIAAPGNDPCIIYTCDPETGNFTETPKCDDGLYCTEDICTIFGECKYSPVSCADKLDMEGYPCFEPRCKEDPENKRYKCVRKLIRNAYIDVCGQCIIEDETNSQSASYDPNESHDTVSCTGAPAKPILTEGLAAASIALIILAAVLIGAGLAASGVIGTKTLIDRAKGANNQSAHSNPLFEESETEMSNPTYAGEN